MGQVDGRRPGRTGVLRFKEEKQAVRDTLATVTLQQCPGADPKMGGWRVGPHGADMILKALEDAGFDIGSRKASPR
jgi:hypothetical protein